MSNLIYPLTLPEIISPQAISGSYAALGVQPGLTSVSNVPPTPSPASVLLLKEEPAPATFPSARCSIKGCVFPSASPEAAKCHYHTLFDSEAHLFQSHQPSHLLLLQAPLDDSDHEPNDFRQQDRKRQTALREAFILDESGEAGS
jgi:hypothetical protein